jgi:hypothetical protein
MDKLMAVAKRYWFVLAAAAFGILYLLTRNNGAAKAAKELMDKATSAAAALRAERDAATQKVDAATEARVEEIAKAETDPDEQRRLQALADIANRPRT